MKKNEMRQTTERIDMLSGSLLNKIFLFAVPLALSSILQQLFNSVDVAVVGHFANSQAQAAVGLQRSDYQSDYQPVYRHFRGY